MPPRKVKHRKSFDPWDLGVIQLALDSSSCAQSGFLNLLVTRIPKMKTAKTISDYLRGSD